MASPLLGSPLSRRNRPGLQFASVIADSYSNTVTCVDPMSPSQPFPQEFKYDTVLDETTTNSRVFDVVVAPLVDSAIETLKASPPTMVETLCFLAYGQTGSGKTHTIFGDIGGEQGLIHEALDLILRRSGGASVIVSFVEIYEKGLFDLLANGARREVRRHKVYGCYIPDLSTVELSASEEWEAKCQDALLLRRSGKSSANARSSRSHALVTFRCHGLRVCFVDLAGSERQDSVLSGPLPKESITINESLTALSRVIQQLAEGQQAPTFRESLLTVLLQRYLAGSSSTTFLCCLHPNPVMINETLSTLRYARRLKAITTMGPAHEDPTAGSRGSSRANDGANRSASPAAETSTLATELNRVRDQAAKIQAAQRDRIRVLEGEVATLRLNSTTGTPNSSANVSHVTIDHMHLSDQLGEPESEVIPMSTINDPHEDYTQDSVSATRGRARSKPRSREGVAITLLSPSPKTPPTEPADQEQQPPKRVLSSSRLAENDTSRVTNEYSVTHRANTAIMSEASSIEEMRCARLLFSWFTRKAAAIGSGEQPPQLPALAAEFDDFFDSMNRPTREVLGYLFVQDPPSNANGSRMPSSTIFATFPISRDLLSTAPTGDDGGGGDVAALIVNLLRWGLPPLFPLHPAQTAGPDAHAAGCGLNAPLPSAQGGSSPFGNTVSIPRTREGAAADDDEVVGQVIAAFEIPRQSTAAARLKSWSCECSPQSTTTALKPFAVVATVNPQRCSADTRRAFMRELLAVEDAAASDDASSTQSSSDDEARGGETRGTGSPAGTASRPASAPKREANTPTPTVPDAFEPTPMPTVYKSPVHRELAPVVHGRPSSAAVSMTRRPRGRLPESPDRQSRSPAVVPIEQVVGLRFVGADGRPVSVSSRSRSSGSAVARAAPAGQAQPAPKPEPVPVEADPATQSRLITFNSPTFAHAVLPADRAAVAAKRAPLQPDTASVRTPADPQPALTAASASTEQPTARQKRRKRLKEADIAKCDCVVA
jgi:hypothetical protein